MGADRSVQFWPGRGAASTLVALCGLIFLLPAASGCGGATAPCPTPTTELDRLRDQAERLDTELERATAQERALRAQREVAGRRIEAAQAALDSLVPEPAR